MAAKRIFVGREGELEEFRQALRSPQGQAILVVGQAGMGKSWLIEEMVALRTRAPIAPPESPIVDHP